MSGYQKVSCKFCKKKFFRETRHYNENLKLGHGFFCSKVCEGKFRKTGREIKCENNLCNNKFYRAPNDISLHNYCSNSCAVTVNNQKHPKRLPLKKVCAECGGEFKSRYSKYCSSKCGYKNIGIHGLKYTREKVIAMIKEYYTKNNRVPAKREIAELTGRVHHMFGSWNKAIEIAGFTPNRSHDHRMYKRTKTKALDGHMCDSVSEAIVDNWLTENKIPHKRNAHYPNSKHLADWSIKENTFIEYFGLAKDSPRYDRAIKEKEKLCEKYNIKLIAIYPKDLYPKVQLQEKLVNIDIHQ